MAFKEVVSLDADTTITLGGIDRKSGKKNPTQSEGFYIGTKKIESKKAKDGFSRLHIFQTQNGNVGIWGKTDLNRKMESVTPGVMVKVVQSGMMNTPNGEMYLYKVYQDADLTIDVSGLDTQGGQEDAYVAEPVQEAPARRAQFVQTARQEADVDMEEETDVDADEAQPDEVPYVAPRAPKQAAQAPDAARQAKVAELLARSRNKPAQN